MISRDDQPFGPSALNPFDGNYKHMTFKLSALALATLCVGAAGSAAAEGIDFKFSGFGTLAATHSSIRSGDYVAGPYQPNGAGYTRNPDFGPDSKLGGQVNVRFGDKLSAVVQVVSQHGYDNSYTPRIEWANVKYQITEGLSVRAGRIALPTFQVAETRYVGYATPWAHVPNDVYPTIPVTNNDGVDLTWRQRFGEASNTFQAYYGSLDSKAPVGRIKSNPTWGLANSAELGSLTLRASYIDATLDFGVPALQGLVAGFTQFANAAAAVPAPAFQAVATQARAMAAKYDLGNMHIKAVALGASYDPGDWFVMGEVVKFKGDSVITDKTSWYVSGGYRFGSWTPFATVGSYKSNRKYEPGITAAVGTPLAGGAAGLNAGINSVLDAFNGSQNSISAGVRWDVVRNVALKAQFDRVTLKGHSAGRFSNIQPASFPFDGKVNLITVAADFVF